MLGRREGCECLPRWHSDRQKISKIRETCGRPFRRGQETCAERILRITKGHLVLSSSRQLAILLIDAALSGQYYRRHVSRHATPLTDRATCSIGS